jgi:superfamily I DNA/RNA helicase
MPDNQSPTHIGTLHSLGNKWNMPFTVEASDDFWDIKLPALLVQHLKDMPAELKYDTVVIDEAQDFHADWWSVVLSALKDLDRGHIYAFGDIRQGIFRQATDIPLQETKLHLTTNLRNSLPIAELAAICVEEPLQLSGLDGPPVQWVECETTSAEKIADQQVELLISQGWNPGDICVLTTGSRHAIQRNEGEGAQSRVYWKKFFEEDATYHCTTTGFKGLERRAVVIAMNGWKEPERKKDILYTSITRARDLLIICGSKEEIVHSGGKEFFKKLSRN